MASATVVESEILVTGSRRSVWQLLRLSGNRIRRVAERRADSPRYFYRSTSQVVRLTIAMSVVLVCSTVHAEQTPAGDALSEIESETVLSMVFADWDDDSIPDKAALVKQYDDQDYATLVVDLSSIAGDDGDLSIKIEDFAWDGLAAGTKASLSLSEVGSLIVNSGNRSIGRDRWQHRLYIAYRRKNLVVAGFYYGRRDSLTNEETDCDVNYLAGYGYKNAERFTFARNVIELKNWHEQKIQDVCE